MQSFVIKNGRVIDPHNGIDEVTDVVIENGRISKIGRFSSSTSSSSVAVTGSDQGPSLDASGCIVTAGLVDCHVHAYQHATPLGINVDRSCLARGVTAVVDAGSSGSGTFSGLRRFIKDQCDTRVYCFLHIAQHGLAAAGCVAPGGGGEIDSLNVVNVQDCVDTIKANRDMVIGVKVRLAVDISDSGKNEQEAYRRALLAAREAGVPLMVHHARSNVLQTGENGALGCPGDLEPGDIYTHCFHGHYGGIVDPATGRVSDACWAAKRRGVLFDVGHGRGAFFWRVAEQCASEGFWPDIISTDLHTQCVEGPSYELTCTMSRMLHLGMELKDIVAAVTSKPAQVIGKLSEIGHLGIGMAADVTVLRIDDISEDLEDVEGAIRSVTKAFTPVAVFREGKQFEILEGRRWPDPEVREKLEGIAASWKLTDANKNATEN
ncbi:deacetylase Oant_2987 [Aplysia californica]|uniref:Deacetylase Oant_2987 n=1 Tax=Aplysia californica TaxID=6500 RepID=A0ABM0K3U0_APLCA|nr:deacetylase Oant_2987 [Aplysia californica]